MDARNTKQVDWQAAANALQSAKQIVIVGHVAPDADDVSSVLAVGMICEALGKSVTRVIEGGLPTDLGYIEGHDLIAGDVTNIDEFDLAIIVDSSAPDVIGRIGNQLLATDLPVLVIDHHQSNSLYGSTHIVDPGSASTTSVLYDWVHYLEVPITQALAHTLLIGILSDTQMLNVGQLTQDTFAKIGDLISHGANYQALAEHMSRSPRPLENLQIVGLGLYRAEYAKGVAWTWLEVEEFERYGLPPGQTRNIVDTLLVGENVVIAAEFAASTGGNVKVSLRSRPGYNVGDVATELGGGGHERAGGCLLVDITTEQAIAKVIPLLQAQV